MFREQDARHDRCRSGAVRDLNHPRGHRGHDHRDRGHRGHGHRDAPSFIPSLSEAEISSRRSQ